MDSWILNKFLLRIWEHFPILWEMYSSRQLQAKHAVCSYLGFNHASLTPAAEVAFEEAETRRSVFSLYMTCFLLAIRGNPLYCILWKSQGGKERTSCITWVCVYEKVCEKVTEEYYNTTLCQHSNAMCSNAMKTHNHSEYMNIWFFFSYWGWLTDL